MRKLDPEFIEMTKKLFPDDCEERIKNFETNEALQKLIDCISEAMDIESPYMTEEPKQDEPRYDPVDRPRHYVEQAATIEPIEILRFAPFDLGNALKYMIRAGHKSEEKEYQDLKKAEWYLECAQKTMGADHVPYCDFFKRYAFILQKFNGIPSDLAENCNCSYINVLLESVRYRIGCMTPYAPKSKTKNEA